MFLERIGLLALLALIAAGPLNADSVYIWTDENGVRHYSNTGIPEEVREADERPEVIVPEVVRSPPEAPDNSSIEEGLADPQEDVPGKMSPEVERGDTRLAALAAKERQMLLGRIKQIENLSIGVSFTPGMKEARLRPLKERLALLEADPQRYFRMKRQGAFGTDTQTEEPPSGASADALGPTTPSSSYGPGTGEATPPSDNP